MNDITWTLDKSFHDSAGNEIHVLQRPLTDLEDAKSNELAPFFQLPSLFELRHSDPRTPKKSARGVLLDIAGDFRTSPIQVVLQTADGETAWEIPALERILLTVWRVNGTLDLIQANLFGSQSAAYMQTGGGILLEVLESSEEAISNRKGPKEMVQLFNRVVRGQLQVPSRR